jgi:putative methionine-R-sulfoxide reductase with GAF domain
MIGPSLSFFKHPCWDVLKKMTDVLRINIFVIDTKGNFIISPNKLQYGGPLITDPAFGCEITSPFTKSVQNLFINGKTIEIASRFGLHYHVIPVITKTLIAHILIGPIIFNKRLENSQYQEMAQNCGIDAVRLMDQLNDLRVISNVTMNAILDLLLDITQHNVILSQNSIAPIQEEMENFLNLIIRFLGAESGSVMLFDDKTNDLIVRAAEGKGRHFIGQRTKIGEGIAGIAAQEKKTFTISKNKADNRIAHLLKRNEIQESVVMPLILRGRLRGILNIHTCNKESRLHKHVKDLNDFSELLAKYLA